jgi:hypothetical protein
MSPSSRETSRRTGGHVRAALWSTNQRTTPESRAPLAPRYFPLLFSFRSAAADAGTFRRNHSPGAWLRECGSATTDPPLTPLPAATRPTRGKRNSTCIAEKPPRNRRRLWLRVTSRESERDLFTIAHANPGKRFPGDDRPVVATFPASWNRTLHRISAPCSRQFTIFVISEYFFRKSFERRSESAKLPQNSPKALVNNHYWLTSNITGIPKTAKFDNMFKRKKRSLNVASGRLIFLLREHKSITMYYHIAEVCLLHQAS